MQALIDRIFDDVVVVSLPRSIDRRSYIECHFADIGISSYRFFDATDSTDATVKAAFADGVVVRYPPCFRCGKDSCDKPDCNNTLIAPQVANVLTYQALWRHLSERNLRTLIFEDDVVIHDYAIDVLHEVAEAIETGALDFDRGAPRLLRLGWALSSDHVAGPVVFERKLRMSNPCHAVTGAYARKLLARGQKIDTTSDIIVHQNTPSPDEAVTVFPPIASDLSWSIGSVPSLIHPKQLHAEHLRRRGDDEAAEAYAGIVERHIKHMYRRRFLIVGHPRCGTGFAAALFRQLGFDIGHEDDGRDGLSSWMFAVDDDAPWAKSPVARNRRALVFDHLVQPVRDPLTAVPSIMRENDWAPVSFDYRRRNILAAFGIDLMDFESRIDVAVASLCLWSQMIAEQSPTLIFRIESDIDNVIHFLRDHYAVPDVAPNELDVSPVNSDKMYKGKRYPKEVLNAADWRSLGDTATKLLEIYCRTYGYLLPFHRA